MEIGQILPQEARKVVGFRAPRLRCKYHFSAEVIKKVYPNKLGFQWYQDIPWS